MSDAWTPEMVAACRVACTDRIAELHQRIRRRRESIPLSERAERYAETDWHREIEALRRVLRVLPWV
jgi:hypothetical protein